LLLFYFLGINYRQYLFFYFKSNSTILCIYIHFFVFFSLIFKVCGVTGTIVKFHQKLEALSCLEEGNTNATNPYVLSKSVIRYLNGRFKKSTLKVLSAYTSPFYKTIEKFSSLRKCINFFRSINFRKKK